MTVFRYVEGHNIPFQDKNSVIFIYSSAYLNKQQYDEVTNTCTHSQQNPFFEPSRRFLASSGATERIERQRHERFEEDL